MKSVVLALAGANGTSGNENEAALLAKSMLEEYMPAHIDTLGSVCGDTGGDGVHIMLDAHIFDSAASRLGRRRQKSEKD